MSTKMIAWGQYVIHSSRLQPPGNSLRLIDAAYGYGFDGVELDVQLSKDNELVLMHNATLDQTTQAKGAVREYTSEELARVQLLDPFDGPPCFIERFATALKRNRDRGEVMMDTHHVSPTVVNALHNAVNYSGFDTKNLILLSYDRDSGIFYKKNFPDSTVLIKVPHNAPIDEIPTEFVRHALGLRGVLLPIFGSRPRMETFRSATSQFGLKLAVYMHTEGVLPLVDALEVGVDYVTSYAPEAFGKAQRHFMAKPKT